MDQDNLKNITDAELVRLTIGGDSSSFEEIVRRHFGTAYAVAYARLRQRETAEELTQEAFVAAYLNLKKLRDPARFAGWLCRITRNLSLKWIRSGRRQSDMLKKLGLETRSAISNSNESSTVADLQAREESDMLIMAIDQLSVEQREAVLLHYGEDFTKKQIASRLGVHPATVGRLLDRALAQLRDELEPKLYETAKALRPNPATPANALLAVSIVSAMSSTAKSAIAGGAALEGIKSGSVIWAAKWPWITAAAVVSICGIGVLLPSALHQAFLSTRSPEDRMEIERFRTEPVKFPKEWAVAHVPSAPVINGMKTIQSEWDKVSGQVTPLLRQLNAANDAGLINSADALATSSIVAARMKATLQATSRTAYLADYRMNDKIDLVTYQNLTRVAVAQAISDATRNDWDGAFQSALLPAYLARRNESAPLLLHGIAGFMLNKTALTLARLAKNCPDAEAIKRALIEINKLYGSIILNVLDQSEILDVLSQLRAYQKAGIAVSMEPGHPILYYYKQILNHRRQYLSYQLKVLPKSSPEYNAAKARLDQPERMNRLLDYAGADISYAASRINTMEMAIREKVVTARLDLARLIMAQRIRQIQGETTATAVKDFVPEFIPAEPDDPFSDNLSPYDSSRAYQWNLRTGNYYSVGPNKIDETKGTRYDPTNGTMSNGDIQLN